MATIHGLVKVEYIYNKVIVSLHFHIKLREHG